MTPLKITKKDREYCEEVAAKCELFGISSPTLAGILGINRVTVWRKLTARWPFTKLEQECLDLVLKAEEQKAAKAAKTKTT